MSDTDATVASVVDMGPEVVLTEVDAETPNDSECTVDGECGSLSAGVPRWTMH